MNIPVHNDILVEQLLGSVVEGKAALRDVPGLLKKILREDAWRERLVRQTGEPARFARFRDFVTQAPLEGLGSDLETLRRLCAYDAEALALLERAAAEDGAL